MHAGTLRHRITLQTRTASADSFGQPIETWSTLATVWASVNPLRGREFFTARQEHTDIDHRIICRANADMTTVHRVLWGSRIFDVQAVIRPEERPIELHLMAKERLGDG
jgi:SPP1 family predicted phage head-tail adaptor